MTTAVSVNGDGENSGMNNIRGLFDNSADSNRRRQTFYLKYACVTNYLIDYDSTE